MQDLPIIIRPARSVALLAILAACGSSKGPSSVGAGSGTAPAVMVAVTTRSPEATSFYVGAYPALPDQVELSEMLETPDGQAASTFNGFVYVWSPDSAIYSRYAVDDQLHLSQDGVVSFMNLGGTGNIMTGFISPTRAYSMTRDNMQIIVWNPTDMTVSGSIDTSAAIDPNYPSFDYGEPVLSVTTSPGPSSGTTPTTSTSSRPWT
jgi:hypothetical protein